MATKEEKIQLNIQKKEMKLRRKNEKAEAKREKKELKRIRKEEKKREKMVDKRVSLRLKREETLEKGPEIRATRKRNEAPKLYVLEEIGNATSHGCGAIFALIAMTLMLMKSHTPLMIASAIVYGICMFLMFFNSCLYHSWKWGSKVKRLWRRFDYSSIYLQIVGTFAPLQLVELAIEYGNTGQIIGIIYFIIMWIAVITGITFACVFGPGKFRKLHFTLYFVIGWSGLSFIPGFFLHNRIPLFLWILGGGIVYSLGMIPFGMLKRKPSAHFIWHFFVIAGAVIQWIGIYLYTFA